MRRQVSVSRSLQLRQKLDAYLDPPTASAEGRLRLVEWSLECGLEVPDRDLLDAGLLAATTFNNAGARLMAGHVRAPELQAHALAITARAHFNEGKYREAAELLDGCWLELAEDPEAPHVLMLRASAHWRWASPCRRSGLNPATSSEAAGIAPDDAWQDRIHGLLEMAAAGDHEGIRNVITGARGPRHPDTASRRPEPTLHAVAQALSSGPDAGRRRQDHTRPTPPPRPPAPSCPSLSGGLYFFNEFVLTRLVDRHPGRRQLGVGRT